MIKNERPRIFNDIEKNLQNSYLEVVTFSYLINDKGEKIKKLKHILDYTFNQIIDRIINEKSKIQNLDCIERFCKLKISKWKKEIEISNREACSIVCRICDERIRARKMKVV